MGKAKFYVVWKGAKPGIYSSWEECSGQIKGFPGALYKSFESRTEAETAFTQKPHLHFQGNKATQKKQPQLSKSNIIKDSICVDGAWSTATGDMEYRGVYMRTGEELFRMGPYRDGTNNIGEFLAIVHALALLAKQQNNMPVYSDSHTALTWIKNKRANTKLQRTENNEMLFDLIDRAEKWLKNNAYKNPLLKWETALWGEIPADFGRK